MTIPFFIIDEVMIRNNGASTNMRNTNESLNHFLNETSVRENNPHAVIRQNNNMNINLEKKNIENKKNNKDKSDKSDESFEERRTDNEVVKRIHAKRQKIN
ncbi:unnamed protein product [Brachionus calyciflorus]|uniref:Uncharacterized protein n=1 Tax=Brachionus calyciflorus TaxID=104777 RepID=A0A813W4D4_9BILA|nr:unnamed protein product [Brachionus calyciflorus]